MVKAAVNIAVKNSLWHNVAQFFSENPVNWRSKHCKSPNISYLRTRSVEWTRCGQAVDTRWTRGCLTTSFCGVNLSVTTIIAVVDVFAVHGHHWIDLGKWKP